MGWELMLQCGECRPVFEREVAKYDFYFCSVVSTSPWLQAQFPEDCY